MQKTESHMKNTDATIRNLEVQIGQLAQKMAKRPTRTFRANTKKNPKEECKAVVTRSQRQKNEETDKVLQDADKEEGAEEEEKTPPQNTKMHPYQEAKREEPPIVIKEAPYPLVPTKKDKEHYFRWFLDIFKRLEITIPFGEALQQMSLYSKFLKDLLAKKGKYINNETIVVGGNYSAMI